VTDSLRAVGGRLEGERILMTGGSGFIGSHFCRTLERIGTPYVVLDLAPPADRTRPDRYVRGDVRDARAVREAMRGCTRVLHLAAAHHDHGILEQTYFDVNAGAAETIVREMVASGLRRVCFFSSVAVYGKAETPKRETDEPLPATPYGASKLAGERVFEASANRGEIDALIVRPSVTFGPSNFANMYSLIRQIEAGRYLHVGDGRNVKSLSYVENLVDFTFWAWSHGRSPLDVYNWVETPDMSSAAIASTLSELLGKSIPRVRLPLSLALAAALPIELGLTLVGRSATITRARVRKLAAESTHFSADKARSEGYVAPVVLTEGLKRTIAWYLETGRSAPLVRRLPPLDTVPFDASAT
jgi:nucleoside-diphosphate-sugar epimerase